MDLFRGLTATELDYLKGALPGVLWPSQPRGERDAELRGVAVPATGPVVP